MRHAEKNVAGSNPARWIFVSFHFKEMPRENNRVERAWVKVPGSIPDATIAEEESYAQVDPGENIILTSKLL